MKKIFSLVIVTASIALAGCAVTVDQDASAVAALAGQSCETTVDSTTALTNQTLCTPSAGPGRHFRIETIDGTVATMGNSTTTSRYYQLGIGYESGKTNSFTGSTAAGNSKLYLAGGRHVTQGSVATWVDFGGETTSNDADLTYADYYAAAKTVCMDVSAASPPQVTVWVTGVKGADCSTRSTLTSSSAAMTKSNWTSATAVSFTGTNYLRITGSAAPRLAITKVVSYSYTALK